MDTSTVCVVSSFPSAVEGEVDKHSHAFTIVLIGYSRNVITTFNYIFACTITYQVMVVVMAVAVPQ